MSTPATERRIADVVVLTSAFGGGKADALAVARQIADRHGISLWAEADDVGRFEEAGAEIAMLSPDGPTPDLCLVLGGDGTILRGLRRFADTDVPVFAVNFGVIGFLSTVERAELEDGVGRAFSGDFEVMDLPALELSVDGRPKVALNDVGFSRRPQGAVAELAYSLGGHEVGNVRCDGLVAATPAGSTGYNLANGGPVMAWGVEGYAVSFIAPHTLTARALVAAPSDVLHVRNEGERDPVDVAIDGRMVSCLDPGSDLEVRFRDGVSRLAQLPGASFYSRIREKFGRLAR